jgi:hypothetical protein
MASSVGASSTVRTVSGRPSSAMEAKVQRTATPTVARGSTTPRSEPDTRASTPADTQKASGISTARSRVMMWYMLDLTWGRPET